MSQAEDLLNSVTESIPVHTHPVPDTDTYFIIDPITRKIENPNRKKNVVMQYDHNSERCTFELPRYIDGHDMLECTSVTVNVDNIEVVEFNEGEEIKSRVNSDAPDITDLRLHPSDPEKAICSWLISRNSTQLAGILSFHIEFKCVDSNGNVVYEWSTDDYEEIEVRARKKNGEAALAPHSDVLEQWRTRIFGAGDAVMANIAAEGEAQVAAVKAESETQQEAVELKGTQTLDSIPEDYTEVDAMADEAVRNKGDAIVCEAAGESIVLKDSSNDHIRGLRLFGKSTQVTTTGKNLFDIRNSIANVSLIASGDTEFSSLCTSDFIQVLPNTTYRVSTTKSHRGKFYNSERIPVTSVFDFNPSVGATFTTTADTRFIRFSYDVAETQIMLEAGTKISPYEPYTGGKPSPSPDWAQEIVSVSDINVSISGGNLISPIDGIIGDTALTTERIYCGPNCTIRVKVTKTRVEGVPITNTRFYPCVLLEKDIYGVERATYPESVVLDSGSETYEIEFTTKPTTSCVRLNLTNNNSDPNLNTRVHDVAVYVGASDPVGYETPQFLAISHTLPGIPVTSGGNYTDSDGQQWICDEVDLERGVYVQRIREVTYNGTDESWFRSVDADSYMHHTKVEDHLAIGQGICYCDKLLYKKTSDIQAAGKTEELLGISPSPKYNVVYINLGYYLSENTPEALAAYLSENPITLHYVLKTPIETPLTAEEIKAFKALRTNYPNTTILNDAGAWMSVKYNADTKTYVDKLKAIRLVDSSTGVICELKIVDGVLVVEAVQ